MPKKPKESLKTMLYQVKNINEITDIFFKVPDINSVAEKYISWKEKEKKSPESFKIFEQAKDKNSWRKVNWNYPAWEIERKEQ